MERGAVLFPSFPQLPGKNSFKFEFLMDKQKINSKTMGTVEQNVCSVTFERDGPLFFPRRACYLEVLHGDPVHRGVRRVRRARS